MLVACNAVRKHGLGDRNAGRQFVRLRRHTAPWAVLYGAICVYPTYLVGTAPGQDITLWRLLLYALPLVASFAFGALTEPRWYWLVPVVVSLAWGFANATAEEPFFDPWFEIPLALYTTAEVACMGLGALARRGTLKRAFVRQDTPE
jgi:hypothetical protein